jgi:hypothetical protein
MRVENNWVRYLNSLINEAKLLEKEPSSRWGGEG